MGKTLSRSRQNIASVMKKKLFRSIRHSSARLFLRIRSRLSSFFSHRPDRLVPRDETRRTHAGTVADLFASIMRQVTGPKEADLDPPLDILRCDFPNVEHTWLIERFLKAYEANYPLDVTLRVAAAGRTIEERVSLVLEICTMIYRLSDDITMPPLLRRVSEGLGLPDFAPVLHSLLSTPGAEPTPPIEGISFSSSPGEADVVLGAEDAGKRFRALRCANILIIVNDSEQPLQVREQTLNKGGMLPLSQGQAVELQDNLLTYRSIRFFLQMKHSGLKLVSYLQLDGDAAAFTRMRQRNSLARISFSEKVELEVLRTTPPVVINGRPFPVGEPVETTYFTPFTIGDLGPYTFFDLNDSDGSERSFQLDPANRTVYVTNLPYMNKPGALLLTAGLAPGIALEVSYSKANNTGTLKVLEGDASHLNVNGEPVRSDTVLRDGDLIGLSAVQSLRCRFQAGLLDEESSSISQLRVSGLTRDFARAGRVVDNVTFTLKKGEMACILGPSGSGKSTLLNMLAGHLAPTMGDIHYNNEKLTPGSTELKRHIAFIPREDILDEAMTVGEHVYQASVVRRPALNHADRTLRVQAVLNFAGISRLSKRQVGSSFERTISDGERTRLNLALDLTGTAEVFLIDEPISGLASRDAERVIDTLEAMASGRILLCSLHRPALSLLKRFRKVLVLDGHGHMAFWGSPDEMMSYFKNAAKELNLRVPHEAIRAGGADYVFEVLEAPFYNPLKQRNLTSSPWQARFEKYTLLSGMKEDDAADPLGPIPKLGRRTPIELARLFWIWVLRTFLARVRSRMGLYALLLEGPVLALLIAGTLKAASDPTYTFYKALHIGEYLFLSLVLAMFFGLTDAACEILRDRPILRRESNTKVFITGYLAAKTLVLTAIAGLQCALYLLVGNYILEIYYMFWPHFLVMLLTAFVGIALSLMVSAYVRSDRTALNIVPLLLVPQILLAGALIRFEDMNSFSPTLPQWLLPEKVEQAFSSLRHRVAYQDEETHDILSKPVPLVAEFCPLRYAFEMIFVEQASGNLWETENRSIDERREQLKNNGSSDEIRFIQRAVMALNASVSTPTEARDLLRRVRKAALSHDEDFLDELVSRIDNRRESPQDQPVEFFFSNRKLNVMNQGVKTARKDSRSNESRGFFLSPRQPKLFGEQDHETDSRTISTIKRNGVYLLVMGLVPILLAALRMRRICRGG